MLLQCKSVCHFSNAFWDDETKHTCILVLYDVFLCKRDIKIVFFINIIILVIGMIRLKK